MKTRVNLLLAATLTLSLASIHAQPGGGMGGMGGGVGPQFGGAMAKLFGANTAFSGAVETQVKVSAGGSEMNITLPGKIAYDTGKSRLDMDLSEMKGGPPGGAEQMKAMGMDKMAMLSRPDRKLMYLIYPGMKSYAEMPLQDADATKPESAFKLEKNELGKETLDGHSCVKSKAIVTDEQGGKHEYTVWNATDMKDFPLRIEFSEQGTAITLVFRDVKLAKPAASSFEPPTGYEKYDNMMKMLQEQMSKRMGGPGGPGGPGGGPGGPPRGNN